MTWNQRSVVWIGILALLTAFTTDLFAQDTSRKPNIVFILADDLGINDLGCYGRKDQPTPNLDKLAREGMRFTSAYSSASISLPTRVAIMTGKAPARLNLPGRSDAVSQLLLHPPMKRQAPNDWPTLAELLRAAGYRTAYLGARMPPSDRGFESYLSGDAPIEQAEKFMETNKEKPLFLFLANLNRLGPVVGKQELVQKHKDAFNPVYAAMVETLDADVGRLIAKVTALGLAENTILVVTSTNGGLHVLDGMHTPATYNRPFRAGKGFLYEGGVRVPLIMRWNGRIKANQISEAPVVSADWTPTFLALAGVASTEKFDGVNLSELLTRGRALSPRPLYWHQPSYTDQGGRPAGAIREGSWKLIEHYENGACELYDLANDLGEANDLAAKEPGRVADLRGKLEKWRRGVGAQENLANPKFNSHLWRRLYHEVDAARLPAEDKAATMAVSLKYWRALMNHVARAKNKAEPGVGAVILHARVAKVHGNKLRYENPPNKDTLGFWVDKSDWAEWTFEVPNAGKFAVEVLQACGKGSGGSVIEIAVKNQALTMKVEETGHFQRFIPRTIGTLTFDAPGRFTLTVRAKTKPGAAVMDLRRIVLRGTS
jgi:arylsulfatase A-like enzyme